MTSKLSFRARALDASKPMTIYDQEDLPELADIPAINRAVPALPTGMEKEEEAEKHLQDILKSESANMVIPTPEVFEADMESIYHEMYKGEFKVGRQYIHVQPFANDHDLPDYDMDSEDETFFKDILQKKFDEVTKLQFEDMIDRLEKNSGVQIVSSRDAKLLLSQDDDLIFAVYDYWVDKRLRLKVPLMPQIKSAETMVGGGSSSGSSGNQGSSSSSSAAGGAPSSNHNNPYICFRRRTEKMQTRKNRKNDESSYEKMLKLRRDLNRAVTLLEMVRRREKMKKQNLEFSADIFEKRVQAGDYDGKMFGEILAGHRATTGIRSILQPTTNHNPFQPTENWTQPGIEPVDSISNASSSNSNKKRPYRKKKNKYPLSRINATPGGGYVSASLSGSKSNGPEFGTSVTSDDDASETEEDEMEGPFAFRRKRGCKYYAIAEPSSYLWPWEREAKYRYSLSSLSTPKHRVLGLVRRRVGRGGRVILDRAYTDFDDEDAWSDACSSTLIESGVHFRPVTPPHCREEDWDPYKSKLSDIPSIPLKPLPLLTALAASREGIANNNNSNSNSSSSHRQKTTTMGLKTVAVDQMSALNAAGALVSNNVIEMFDNKN